MTERTRRSDASEQERDAPYTTTSHARDVGTTDAEGASVETPNAFNRAPTVDVRATWFDDEPGGVHLRTQVGDRRVEITLEATDARQLAEQIAEAARHAQEGTLE